MSFLTALYNAYERAEKDGLVDAHELSEAHIVILPLFHTNSRSDGSNIVELKLTADGSVIDCDFLHADHYAVFPVTEKSATRTANISAHPLCDKLSYTSKKFDEKRFENFRETFQSWYDYAQEKGSHPLLDSVHALLEKKDMFDAVYDGLRQKYRVTLDEKNNFLLRIPADDGKKATDKKIKTADLLVTYCLSSEDADSHNLTSTSDKKLHGMYIDYVRHLNSQKKEQFDICDITGEYTYCTDIHRGLLGNAKVISTSHNETYKGRFRTGNEVVRLSHEATEKAHLMLKFYLEHKDNNSYLGEATYALIWFEHDLFNRDHLDLANPDRTPKNARSTEKEESTEETRNQAVESDVVLSSETAKRISKAMIGLEEHFSQKGSFYILIINKISNGRIAIQYFRELPNSELIKRMSYWYGSTAWPRYMKDGKKLERSPSLFDIIDSLYGRENDKGYLSCENKKLRTLAFRRLLPSIIDGKPLPADFARIAYINFTKRKSYKKSWPQMLYIACSLINKTRYDHNQGGFSGMLETSQQTRDYKYGRLLALYEKLEKDATSSANKDEAARETNAQKLWAAYLNNPERTLKVLEDKIKPYKKRLSTTRPKSLIFYHTLIAELTTSIRDAESYQDTRNKALNEDAVFGYYAQNQALYSKKDTPATADEKPSDQ